MKHDFLDKYSQLDSPVHALDPRAKILAALSGIIIIVSEPLSAPLMHFVLYMAVITLVAIFSAIPLRYILKRMAIVSPFILMAALFYPLSVYLTDKDLYLANSEMLNNSGIIIFLKASCCIILLILLTSTERFNRLLLALGKLKIPGLIITISALIYRYIFILSDEFLRTTRARESRTPGNIILNRFRVFGNQVAVIFLRSWERSQIIYKSMLSRGFTGTYPDSRRLRAGSRDIFWPAVFVLLMMAARLSDLFINH